MSTRRVVFHATKLNLSDLYVSQLSGREALGEPFAFDVQMDVIPMATSQGPHFGSRRGPDEIQQGLGSPAILAFRDDSGPPHHKVHGVISRIEVSPATENRGWRFRLQFVPRIATLGLTRRTRLFQNLDVVALVSRVLTDNGMAQGTDFDWRLTGRYPQREYVVQYEETDLAFVLRSLEHWGITLAFEHGDDHTTAILSDSNAAFRAEDERTELRFDARTRDTDNLDVIQSIGQTRQLVPGTVAVMEYNWRTPSVALLGEASVPQMQQGEWVEYGQHFKDMPEGRRMAQIRAEASRVPDQTFFGHSRVRGLRPGQRFTLDGHGDWFDQAYVVTSVEHEVAQPTDRSLLQRDPMLAGYSNKFTAIPAGVTFRPERRTPRPRIEGLSYGIVDDIGSANAAPVDDQGRYRVVMPCDSDGQGGGTATRWIRMAQIAAGPSVGLHFPVHAGTEVIIAHINGDPDRPVIIGAMANVLTNSPVTSANATKSLFRSHTGVEMEFEDDA